MPVDLDQRVEEPDVGWDALPGRGQEVASRADEHLWVVIELAKSSVAAEAEHAPHGAGRVVVVDVGGVGRRQIAHTPSCASSMAATSSAVIPYVRTRWSRRARAEVQARQLLRNPSVVYALAVQSDSGLTVWHDRQNL